MLAANIAVKPPTQLIISNPVLLYSINGDNLINKYTPAVTIVAAWINAETGVGPSIASGNQVWRPNCADFAIAPINTNMVTIVIHSTSINRDRLNIVDISRSPKIHQINIIPKVKLQSPTRFTINAFIAALLACILLYQKFTNIYEHTPTKS